MERSIVLIGMMGSGKTTIGKKLSKILGLPFVDTDTLIEEKEERTISDIFAESGEDYFREIETQVLRDVLNAPPSVISTGGGIILSKENRELIKQKAIPVFLYAKIDTLIERLSHATDRPLLEGDTLKNRLETIWNKRKALYEEFENRIETDRYTPDEIARMILFRFLPPDDMVYIDKHIIWGLGATKALKGFLAQGYIEPLLVVTSSSLWDMWGEYVREGLNGLDIEIFFLPEGEEAKTLEYVHALWDKMYSLGFTRKNPVLLLGGGTVGDTGGFAASTFMRGIPLFQLPTTLLSQVDSSIGGKRGVNYKHLKNMIGSFYDASLTLFDPIFLLTLPINEIKNGLSEAIKTGIIGDPALFDLIDLNMDDIFDYNLKILGTIVKKAAKVKINVVNEDPYETKGYRKVLNLGHTLGHALEGIESFSISHGEGVAIGMVFAAFLGEELGITPHLIREKIEGVIKKAKLPVSFPETLINDVIDKMYHDKKREDDKLFWVIPEDIGKVGFYKFEANKIKKMLCRYTKEYPYET